LINLIYVRGALVAAAGSALVINRIKAVFTGTTRLVAQLIPATARKVDVLNVEMCRIKLYGAGGAISSAFFDLVKKNEKASGHRKSSNY
jgi:hypothetical protein